jgi:hypothetical protein
MIDTLIGRRFWLHPRSTVRKEGMLLSVDEHGICLKITMTNDCKYKVGDILFYSKSTPFSGVLLKDGEEE